jgi:hypothetical protein
MVRVVFLHDIGGFIGEFYSPFVGFLFLVDRISSLLGPAGSLMESLVL